MIDTDWGLCFGRDRRARSVRLRLPGVQRRGVCRRGHPRADSGRRVRVVRLASRDGRIRPAPAQVVTWSAVPRFADGDGDFCRWPRSFFGRESPPRFLGLREDSPRTRLHHRAVSSTAELKASSSSLASLVGTPSPTVPNYTLEIPREYNLLVDSIGATQNQRAKAHAPFERHNPCVTSRSPPEYAQERHCTRWVVVEKPNTSSRQPPPNFGVDGNRIQSIHPPKPEL